MEITNRIDDAVARVVCDKSQTTKESWPYIVRRAMLESQEIGRREIRAEIADIIAARPMPAAIGATGGHDESKHG